VQLLGSKDWLQCKDTIGAFGHSRFEVAMAPERDDLNARHRLRQKLLKGEHTHVGWDEGVKAWLTFGAGRALRAEVQRQSCRRSKRQLEGPPPIQHAQPPAFHTGCQVET
jgi:hypothetical protein